MVAGLLLKFGSPLLLVLVPRPSPSIWSFLVLYVLGTLLYLAGCCLFARAKNRPALWGLTGLLCVLGLPILFVLEDRAADGIGA
jgi:hypothetical protein